MQAPRPTRGDRRTTSTLAALVVLGMLAWVLTPVVLLHPFRAQSASGVALAYELRGGSPLVTLAGLVLLLPLLRRLGGQVTRRWSSGSRRPPCAAPADRPGRGVTVSTFFIRRSQFGGA